MKFKFDFEWFSYIFKSAVLRADDQQRLGEAEIRFDGKDHQYRTTLTVLAVPDAGLPTVNMPPQLMMSDYEDAGYFYRVAKNTLEGMALCLGNSMDEKGQSAGVKVNCAYPGLLRREIECRATGNGYDLKLRIECGGVNVDDMGRFLIMAVEGELKGVPVGEPMPAEKYRRTDLFVRIASDSKGPQGNEDLATYAALELLKRFGFTLPYAVGWADRYRK